MRGIENRTPINPHCLLRIAACGFHFASSNQTLNDELISAHVSNPTLLCSSTRSAR